VSLKSHLYRASEFLAELSQTLLLAQRGWRRLGHHGIVEVPVLVLAYAFVIYQQVMSGLQAMDVLQQRRGTAQPGKRRHLVETRGIHLSRDARVLEDCLDFRSENEGSSGGRVVERGDSDGVARQKELTVAQIEDREGELTIDPLHHRRTAFLVK